MHFNPYGEAAVGLAADLANDRPSTCAELLDRCRRVGLLVPPRCTTEDLEDTLAFLTQWETVVDGTDADARAAALNALLAQHSGHPRVTNHAGDGWHLHFRREDAPLGEILTTLFAVGTALLLTGRSMHRIGRCAADECERIYVDTSRNGTKRYCGTRCTNRAGVRRHRAHRLAAGVDMQDVGLQG